jgi:hypothetical protein
VRRHRGELCETAGTLIYINVPKTQANLAGRIR